MKSTQMDQKISHWSTVTSRGKVKNPSSRWSTAPHSIRLAAAICGRTITVYEWVGSVMERRRLSKIRKTSDFPSLPLLLVLICLSSFSNWMIIHKEPKEKHRKSFLPELYGVYSEWWGIVLFNCYFIISLFFTTTTFYLPWAAKDVIN